MVGVLLRGGGRLWRLRGRGRGRGGPGGAGRNVEELGELVLPFGQLLEVEEEDADVDQAADDGEEEVVQRFVNVHLEGLLVRGEVRHFRGRGHFEALAQDEETDFRDGETDPAPFYGAGTFL